MQEKICDRELHKGLFDGRVCEKKTKHHGQFCTVPGNKVGPLTGDNNLLFFSSLAAVLMSLSTNTGQSAPVQASASVFLIGICT